MSKVLECVNGVSSTFVKKPKGLLCNDADPLLFQTSIKEGREITHHSSNVADVSFSISLICRSTNVLSNGHSYPLAPPLPTRPASSQNASHLLLVLSQQTFSGLVTLSLT
jgi:hypothetical protein